MHCVRDVQQFYAQHLSHSTLLRSAKILGFKPLLASFGCIDRRQTLRGESIGVPCKEAKDRIFARRLRAVRYDSGPARDCPSYRKDVSGYRIERP